MGRALSSSWTITPHRGKVDNSTKDDFSGSTCVKTVQLGVEDSQSNLLAQLQEGGQLVLREGERGRAEREELSRRLTGAIPLGITSLTKLRELYFADNQVSGSIPEGLLLLKRLFILEVSNNQLFGSLAVMCDYVRVRDNQLTGCLPSNLIKVCTLVASGNMFEGPIPSKMSYQLKSLLISGQLGNERVLTGRLPRALCRTNIREFAAARQALQGIIPSLTATLYMLSLQNNKLQIMSDLHMTRYDHGGVFVHNNILSCHLPLCGNSTTIMSLSGLGNQLSRPEHGFPAWVSPIDRDRLFWVHDREGLDLLMKFLGSCGLLATAVATKFRGPRLSRWYCQPGGHQKLVFQCYELLACVTRGALVRLLVLVLLLSWDLYSCPRTMALASACLRNDTLTHIEVLALWGHLSFHGHAVQSFIKSGDDVPQATHAPRNMKKTLFPVLFVLIQVVLSLPAILLQACISIPGGLWHGNAWVGLVLSASIGILQAMMASLVVPPLAEKLTGRKYVYITLSNLLLNFMFPAIVILGLDLSAPCRFVAICDLQFESRIASHG